MARDGATTSADPDRDDSLGDSCGRSHVATDRHRAGRTDVATIRRPVAVSCGPRRRRHASAARGLVGSRVQPPSARPARGGTDDRRGTRRPGACRSRGAGEVARRRAVHRACGRCRGVRRRRRSSRRQRPPGHLASSWSPIVIDGSASRRGWARVPPRAWAMVRRGDGSGGSEVPAPTADVRGLPAGDSVFVSRRCPHRGTKCRRRGFPDDDALASRAAGRDRYCGVGW